jgi:hypothetical protein
MLKKQIRKLYSIAIRSPSGRETTIGDRQIAVSTVTSNDMRKLFSMNLKRRGGGAITIAAFA